MIPMNKFSHVFQSVGLFVAILVLAASCQQDLPLYSDEQARLNFFYENEADSVVPYSFIYNRGGSVDTIWLSVSTMGFLGQADRTLRLRQVPTGESDAVAGVHYVDFSDDAYSPYFIVPAGEVRVSVPVIVLRDASLANGDVTLKVAFEATSDFVPGYPERGFKRILISDQLVKPTRWGGLMDFIFGAYGRQKHLFMIQHSTFNWDDEFLRSIGVSLYYADDQAYLRYMCNKFARELRAENEKRVAAGLPVLSEADGTPVSFALY